MSSAQHSSPRILVVRRDNIGDLLCTTPLLRAIRKRHPDAYLAVLASSYNAEAIEGNPDIDDVFVFPKRQQRSGSMLELGFRRWQLVRKLRSLGFDEVVLANGGWRFARGLGGKCMIGFRERDNPEHKQPDVVVALENGSELHEVEKMDVLGRGFGISSALGPLKVFPPADAVGAVRERLAREGFDAEKPCVALHISSRRSQQRWPEASYIALAGELAREDRELQFLLFWSPGGEDDPMHPGDDAKAARILHACRDLPMFACPTTRVRELIAGMSIADRVVCSDGGALHVAAALGKSIVCFFGDSIAAEWRPWGVPYVLLQPPSKRAEDITVAEACAGFRQLGNARA